MQVLCVKVIGKGLPVFFNVCKRIGAAFCY